jgi:hypothetical protein
MPYKYYRVLFVMDKPVFVTAKTGNGGAGWGYF